MQRARSPRSSWRRRSRPGAPTSCTCRRASRCGWTTARRRSRPAAGPSSSTTRSCRCGIELGRLEEGREGWTAAQDAYARALDILPTYLEAGLALGDLLRRRMQHRLALDVLVELLTTDPYAVEALVLLGKVLFERGWAPGKRRRLRSSAPSPRL